MTMGSSAVSPWASISMVAFSAVSDGLVAAFTAAGGSFVVAVSVALEGWLSSVLAVGDFLFAGSCCRILLAVRVSSFRLSICAKLWATRSCTYLGTDWVGSKQCVTPLLTMTQWDLIHAWTASAISLSVASGGGAASEAATDGGAAAGRAPCLLSHCCITGGMMLFE